MIADGLALLCLKYVNQFFSFLKHVFCAPFLVFRRAREAGFGVSFDHTIKFHRWMGQIAYLLSTAHMVLWFVKWALQGLFWTNLFAIVGLTVSDGAPDNNIHWVRVHGGLLFWNL